MSFAITIDGVDKTSSIQWKTFRKRDNLNQQVDKCTFEVWKYGSHTYAPTIGDEVNVTRDGSVIFGGVIVRISENVEASTKLVYSIECVDYSQYLKRQLVTERYEDMTVQEIIDDLVTNYTVAGDSITTNGVEGALDIASISFNRLTVADSIQKLANALSYVWYVGYDKDIHFFPKNAEVAPYGLTDTSGNYIYNSLKIVEDISQVKNSVLVQGGDAVSASTRTEYFSGDGVIDLFSLASKFDAKPTVTVGGVAQTVGTEFIDQDASYDCMWDFNQKTLRFTSGNIPAAGTRNIVVTAKYRYPIVVKVPAPASQTAYGLYEHAITDKSIKSQDEAIKRAQASLTSYRSTLYEGEFKTNDDGLRSGQVLNINSTQRGKNIDVLIQSVDAKMQDPTATKLEYVVRFATLKSVGIIDYLQDQLRDKTIIEDDADTLLNYYPLEDGVSTSDSLATPSTTSPPYYVGTTAKMGYSTIG